MDFSYRTNTIIYTAAHYICVMGFWSDDNK